LSILWGLSPQGEHKTTIKVGKTMVKPVYGPAFAMFCSAVERSLFLALKKGNLTEGYTNRHSMFRATNNGRGGKRTKPKYHWTQCPVWLRNALREVAGVPAPVDNRERDVGAGFKFRQIGWGAGAEELYDEFEDEIREMPSGDARTRAIRAPEIALRWATVVAVYRGSEVVEVEDLQWAIAVVRHSTSIMQHGHDKVVLEAMQLAELTDFLRELYAKHGTLTYGKIRKECERKVEDYRMIDQANGQLLATKEIVAKGYSGAGRPTEGRWTWVGSRSKR
jgi:hypothetical protein